MNFWSNFRIDWNSQVTTPHLRLVQEFFRPLELLPAFLKWNFCFRCFLGGRLNPSEHFLVHFSLLRANLRYFSILHWIECHFSVWLSALPSDAISAPPKSKKFESKTEKKSHATERFFLFSFFCSSSSFAHIPMIVVLMHYSIYLDHRPPKAIQFCFFLFMWSSWEPRPFLRFLFLFLFSLRFLLRFAALSLCYF